MELQWGKGSKCADLEDQWPAFDYLPVVLHSINKERTSKQSSVQTAMDGIMLHRERKTQFLNDRSGSSHSWSWPQGSPLNTVRRLSKKKLPKGCFCSCVTHHQAPFLFQRHSSLIVTIWSWLHFMSKVALSVFQQVRVSCAPFLNRLCFELSLKHVHCNWRWTVLSY